MQNIFICKYVYTYIYYVCKILYQLVGIIIELHRTFIYICTYNKYINLKKIKLSTWVSQVFETSLLQLPRN